MFRKITSNRNPRDTLYSEIKKEFSPYHTTFRGWLQRVTKQYPKFLFAMMVINITLSMVLVFKVLLHPVSPKKVIVTTPSGFDKILEAGEKLKKTIALKRIIDSLTSKPKLTAKDSVTLDSTLDQFQKLKP